MATLTVTITESLPDYNGVSNDLALSNSLEIAGVDDIYHRVITCKDDIPVTVANFHATTGASDSSLDVENVRYIRITNLESSNSVILDLQIDTAEDDSAAADQGANRDARGAARASYRDEFQRLSQAMNDAAYHIERHDQGRIAQLSHSPGR